jgi:hypothetical protein
MELGPTLVKGPSELVKAIFGIARVDLLNPIKPIKQGLFNERPINKKAVDQLVQDMETQGVRSDSLLSAIPLLANPQHIDLSSTSKDITSLSEAPDLKLSEKGLDEVTCFRAAGGNHRTAALRLVHIKIQDTIDELETKVKNLDKKEKDDEKTKVAKKEFKAEVRRLKAKQARNSKWTVILYDEGKCNSIYCNEHYALTSILDTLMANNCQLAGVLARNERDVRRVEDDAEKTTMRFLEYRRRRQVKEKESGRVLSNAERNVLSKSVMENAGKDISLKHCLQSEDVISYWETLASVLNGKPYLYTTYFSSKWSDKTIHQPGGGVSNTFFAHCIRILTMVAAVR